MYKNCWWDEYVKLIFETVIVITPEKYDVHNLKSVNNSVVEKKY